MACSALALALACAASGARRDRCRSRGDPRPDPATEGELRGAHPGARAAAEGRRGASRSRAPSHAAAPPRRRQPPPAAPPAVAGRSRRRGRASARSIPRSRRCCRAPTRNLSQDPNKYALSGFAPSGDIAPGKRGFSLGESELAISANVDDKFFGNLIVSLTPENTVVGRGGVRAATPAPATGSRRSSGASSPASAISTTSTSTCGTSSTRRSSTRRFSAASTTRRPAAEVGRADRHSSSSSAASSATAKAFPGRRATRTASARASPTSTPAATSATSNSWRAGLSYLQTRAQRSRLRADRRLRQRSRRSASPAAASSRSPTSSGSTRPTATRSRPTSSCRASISGGARAAISPTTATARSGSTQHVELRRAAKRLVRAGRLPVHAGVARRRALRPARSGPASTTAPTPRTSRTRSFNPQRSTVMLDWTPSEFSRFRLQFAQAKLRPKASPTTSSSSNTS